jgi:formate hydrogenlyase subunit 6/NADH:ubiquinone oxidoreductase subunit I
MAASHVTEHWVLAKSRLDDLIQLLAQDGCEVIGPRLEQAAIVYAPIRSAKDLPIGWTDRQAPGSYRLEKRDDEAYFGYAVGPHSWKKYLFPPVLRLWQARRTENGFDVQGTEPDPPPRAFLGVRACELHAIAVQDRAFLNREGRFTDPHYARARERLFLVAVECEHPGGTCFCTSMGTGPEVPTQRVPLPASTPAKTGATQPDSAAGLSVDLVLTELNDAFVVRAGSAAGQGILDRLNLGAASAQQVDEARRRVAAAAQSMGRTVDVTDIRALLHGNQEHPRWDEVAGRCLACTNCTLVCPTCFCSSVEDVTDLGLGGAERVRRWDSCFNPEFARVHGGNFRPSIRGRYRQWLTHKFASWYDQFGVSGCVGCGRCITWCPVGIDVTEEITAIQTTDGRVKEETP